ncbi:MAG: nicotinate phosphoribosyltransferase [Acidobacteria bacterium]|nr:nicotinate phosphoribosyltransferase [Acidobacteriota bacterium]
MPQPTNSLVNSLLTDLYQLTMAYAYWSNGRQDDAAVFDLFFRKPPFDGEFTVFAGLEEVLRLLESYRFTADQIEYLKTVMSPCRPEFFEWLASLDTSCVKVYSVPEGTLVFPRIPLLRVEGPLAIAQLLETTLLTLVNYASLVATNAARFRLAAGTDKLLLEFGLRRAQGPDGGISASLYSFLGGFDATSNVLAGKLYDIPVRGTHAHSYVQTFQNLAELPRTTLTDRDGNDREFVTPVLDYRRRLGYPQTNEGELASFIAYAQAFPAGFLALVDTYDTIQSGIPNFLCVALALIDLGYDPVGIRLDSGDLAHLSNEARRIITEVGRQLDRDFSRVIIVASNEINEQILLSLNNQGHSIDAFGIGTNLVTCQAQPALGCVYKLVAIQNNPRIKLSQEIGKITIPGPKDVYRIIGKEGYALLDLLVQTGEPAPRPGEKVLCRHPFNETKRVIVTPTEVISLHQCVWDGQRTTAAKRPDLIRQYVKDQLMRTRKDHLRAINPTPYKVSVSQRLYEFLHGLWLAEAPVSEME